MQLRKHHDADSNVVNLKEKIKTGYLYSLLGLLLFFALTIGAFPAVLFYKLNAPNSVTIIVWVITDVAFIFWQIKGAKLND